MKVTTMIKYLVSVMLCIAMVCSALAEPLAPTPLQPLTPIDYPGIKSTVSKVAVEDNPMPLNEHQEGWSVLHFVAHVFPPFQYKKDGKIVGPFYEVMKAICTKASINCWVHMHSWKDAYADLVSGEVDGMFSFLISEDIERSKLVKFGVPIVETYYSFFVSSTSEWKWTGNVKDLDNRTVGVYGPGSGTHIIASTARRKLIG